MTLTVLDTLPDALLRSWQDQRGAALSVRVTHQREAHRVARDAYDLAAAAGAAVSSLDGHAGPSLFRHLCTGRSPVLSPTTARLLDALEDRLAQIRLLERLLRCHARHRAVLLVVDPPVEFDASAKWILEQLPALLDDAGVTWLRVRHDQPAGAAPLYPRGSRRVTTATSRTATARPVVPA
jgi:hypothetical protein